jgi:hypothetical protein
MGGENRIVASVPSNSGRFVGILKQNDVLSTFRKFKISQFKYRKETEFQAQLQYKKQNEVSR